MTTHPDDSATFELSGPLASDGTTERAPPEPGWVTLRLSALRAMLARTPAQVGSTLYGQMSLTASELARALSELQSPASALALALASQLGRAALGREGLSDSQRAACQEAVERLAILHSGMPVDRGPRLPNRPRVVIATPPETSATRLRQKLALGGFRCLALPEAEIVPFLHRRPCELILFWDPHGDRSAAGLCADVRRLDPALHKPVLCLTSHPDIILLGRHSPLRGLRLAPAGVGPEELALRIYTVLA